MTLPNRSELIFYTNQALDDADYEANWLTVLDWLTDGARTLNVGSLTAGSMTVSGNLTVTGDITANSYFGDGSNLTGISASASGVAGIQTLEIQAIAEKLSGFKMPSSQRTNVSENIIVNDNFTAELQSNYTANQTLISFTLSDDNYAPVNTELIAEDTSTGAYYDFQVTSIGADSYPTVTYICTPINANLTAGSCNIYRNTVVKNVNTNKAEIDTSKTGNSLLVQTLCTPQKNLGTALVSQSVDWELIGELPQYTLSRTGGDLTTSTFKIAVSSDVSSEFITDDSSGTEATGVLTDRNKVAVTKSRNSGNGSINTEVDGAGGIFTLTSVSYATGFLTLTVVEDTATVIDSDDITDKNITYKCSPLYFVPKVSAVADAATAESFSEVTPTEVLLSDPSKTTYFEDSFNRSSSATVGNDWSESQDGAGASPSIVNDSQLSLATSGAGTAWVYRNNESYDLETLGRTVKIKAYVIPSNTGSTTVSGYYSISYGADTSSPATLDGLSIVINEAASVWTLKIYETATEKASAGITISDGAEYELDIELTRQTAKARVYQTGTAAPAWQVSWDNSSDITLTGAYLKVGTRSTSGSLTSLTNNLDVFFGNPRLILKGVATAQSGARLSGKADLLIPVSTGFQSIETLILSPR